MSTRWGAAWRKRLADKLRLDGEDYVCALRDYFDFPHRLFNTETIVTSVMLTAFYGLVGAGLATVGVGWPFLAAFVGLGVLNVCQVLWYRQREIDELDMRRYVRDDDSLASLFAGFDETTVLEPADITEAMRRMCRSWPQRPRAPLSESCHKTAHSECVNPSACGCECHTTWNTPPDDIDKIGSRLGFGEERPEPVGILSELDPCCRAGKHKSCFGCDCACHE